MDLVSQILFSKLCSFTVRLFLFCFFFTLSASEVFNNSVTLISRGGDAPRVHHVSLSAD